MTKIFMKFEKKLREEKKKLKEENLKKEKMMKKKENKEKLKKNKEELKTQKTKKSADTSSDGFRKRDTFIRILNNIRKREVLSIKLRKETDIEEMDMTRSHTIHITNECKSNEIKLVTEKFINKVKEEYFERCVSENPRPAIKTLRRKFSLNEALVKPAFNEPLATETFSGEKSISAECEVRLSTSSIRLEELPSTKSVPRVKISTKPSLAKPSTNTSSMKSPTKSSIETLTISLSSEKAFSANKRLLPPSATPIAEPFGSIDQILDLWLMPISSFTQILQKLQNEKKMNLRNEVAAKISCKKSDPLLVVEDIFRRTQNLEEVFDLSMDVNYLGTRELLVRKEYLKPGQIHLKPEEILVNYDQEIIEADLNSGVIHQITDRDTIKIRSKSTVLPTNSIEHKLNSKIHTEQTRRPAPKVHLSKANTLETGWGLVLNISNYLETIPNSTSLAEPSSTTKTSSSQDISMRPFKLQKTHYESRDLQLESFPKTLSRNCYEARKGLPFRVLT